KQLLQEQKERIINGCVKNNISKDIAEKFWQLIEPFDRYGFNRSHAVCYAFIAYRTAYLKAHYPQEFMAALLTADLNDLDRIAIEIEETRKLELLILPPDINESLKTFTVVLERNGNQIIPTNKIRFGLLAIKNVGEGIVEAIIAERRANGPFETIENFLKRIQTKDLNKKSLDALIKAGALDRFGERNMLLANVSAMLEFNKKDSDTDRTNQSSLFGDDFQTSFHLEPSPAAHFTQKLLWEKEFLGIFISAHPLDAIKPKIIALNAQPIKKIIEAKRLEANTVGLIAKIKRIITNAKEVMAFVTIEDPSGAIEVIIFSSLYQMISPLMQENKIIHVIGRRSDKDGIPKIVAEKITEIPLI
ncbi:MAG: DNA polymerase III subunit alpha, partial [Parcubacteria group bacterium]|nr:DNA polymerase III subunit alpha [Parcubacteria group bacterium]